MKISKSFIQAVGILVMLAEQPSGKPLKAEVISERMQASHSYLLKIANKLKKASLVTTIISKNGGFLLAKAPAKISYFDIYQAIEGPLQIDTSESHVGVMFEHQDLVRTGKEELIATLMQAEDQFEAVLKEHFLAELVPRNKNGEFVVIDWSTR